MADEGQSLAAAGWGASGLTQQLVVPPWTLCQAVTQVVHVQTHTGAPTTVESRTCVVVTPCLVFVSWTVVHVVATDINRQTVAKLARTAEMRLRACLGCV